jgi:hypothetical protein
MLWPRECDIGSVVFVEGDQTMKIDRSLSDFHDT